MPKFCSTDWSKKTTDKVAGERQFIEAYGHSPDKRYVILEKYLPPGEAVIKLTELLYIVYPYETGDRWMIHAVNKSNQGFAMRKPLPESWRGLDSAELAALTGVDDAIFCHNSGFIGAAKSRQGATKLLELALVA